MDTNLLHIHLIPSGQAWLSIGSKFVKDLFICSDSIINGNNRDISIFLGRKIWFHLFAGTPPMIMIVTFPYITTVIVAIGPRV